MNPPNRRFRISRRFFYGVLALLCPVAAWSVTRGFEGVPGPVVASYRVTLREAGDRVLAVEGRVEGLTGNVFPLGTSTGGPLASGRSQRFVVFQAYGPDGKRLEVETPQSGRWVVHSGGESFRFEYEVYLTVIDRFSSGLSDLLPTIEDDHARLIGYAFLIQPLVDVTGPIPIEFVLPEGWSLFATHEAGDDRLLVPEPSLLPNTVVALGSYEVLSRDILGVHVRFVTRDSDRRSAETFFERIGQVCRWQMLLFGSIPRREYLFVCDRNPIQSAEGFDYYGLHFASSMILLLEGDLGKEGMSIPALRIVSHEFFHNWNGDALSPASLSLNWFTEGVTQYYAHRTLIALGYVDRESYDAELSRLYSNSYVENPYLETVTIAEAGERVLEDKALTRLLYDGGLLVADRLDQEIRAVTGGARSLDDLIRELYRQSVESGRDLDLGLLDESLRSLGAASVMTSLMIWVGQPGSLDPPRPLRLGAAEFDRAGARLEPGD